LDNQGAISDNSRFDLYACFKVTLRALAIAALPLMLSGPTTPPLSFAGVQTTVPVSGLASPAGVSFDSSGNLFVLDSSGNQVIEVPANGSPQKVVAGGLNAPSAIASDAFGNLYISNGPQVIKAPADGSPQTALPIAGLVAPAGLAVDSSGNVYIADAGGANVIEFSALGAQTTMGSGWSVPTGISVDLGGNVYVADKGLGYIVKIPAGGGTPVSIGSGLVSPISVAVDLSGNVIVGVAAGQIFDITQAGAVQTMIGSGSLQPLGLASRQAGTIFVADGSSNTALEIQTVPVDFAAANLCAAGQNTPAPCQRTLTLNYAVNTTTNIAPPAATTQGAQNLDFTIAPGGTCSGTLTAGSTCAVNVNFAPQAPGGRVGALQISDTTGNTLIQTFLRGVGNGPQMAFGPATTTTLNVIWRTPAAIVADSSGDVYVIDDSGLDLWKASATGSSIVASVPTGLDLSSIALDGAGNLYYIVSWASTGPINELPFKGGSFGPLVTIPNSDGANSVAVDGSGNVYGSYNNIVQEFPAGNSPPVQVAATRDGASINWIAVDSGGDIFIASTTELIKSPASGGTPQLIASGNFLRFAVDTVGNVYAMPSAGGVVEYPVSGGSPITISSSSWSGGGVAADSAGNVYYTGGVPYLTNVQAWRRSPQPPPAFSFATSLTGQASPDSPKSILITNTGNQNLSFSSIGFASGRDFALAAGSGVVPDCTSNPALAASVTCNLSFSFVPAEQGNLSDTLLISDNAANATLATQSFSASGIGLASASATQTSLRADTTSAIFGEPVTLTATVTTTLGVLTGNVGFFSGTTSLGTAALNSNGIATLITTMLPAGAHVLTATYIATPWFQTSTSPGVPVTIVRASFNTGSANVCPAGQTKPAPCSRKLTLTYRIQTNATLGTPKVVTQAIPNLDYTLAATTCSGPVTAGSTCTITVDFAPRLAGARPGAAQIVDSSGTVLQTFFLSGVGVAPQVGFNETGAIPLANSPQSLSGIAVDAAGNIYWPSSQIMLWPAGGGASIPLSNFDGYDPPNNGYFTPLVVDGAGNVYVNNLTDGLLYRIPAGGGSQTSLGASAGILAVDAASNVYYQGWYNAVQKIPAGATPRSRSIWVTSLSPASRSMAPEICMCRLMMRIPGRRRF
jgi:hypothetical protein